VEVDSRRCQWLNGKETDVESGSEGPIVYWMLREKRAEDNFALLKAQSLALACGAPLAVVFLCPAKYMLWKHRHYHYALKGMKEVCNSLREHNIPMHSAVTTDMSKDLLQFCKDNKVRAVVTDFFPMREKMGWDEKVQKGLGKTPFCRVDAHNVIPCWETSKKREYAARTIRPKIHNKVDEFLKPFPVLEKMAKDNTEKTRLDKPDFDEMLETLKEKNDMDMSIGPVETWKPGPEAAKKQLEKFLSPTRLGRYSTHRNNPNHGKVTSNLSPYMNMGFIAPQRVIMDAKDYAKSEGKVSSEDIQGFVEECLVRRELTDNYCYYEQNYDSLDAAYQWARDTLQQHAKDKREHIYTYEQLAQSQTHDDLWNAAQTQAREEGKMHGWLRMYWSKQILTWTESPEQALEFSFRLNDEYNLDGGDPNSVVGTAWSLMGIHDQGWTEREIFGKIRCMNYNGAKRKFSIPDFVTKYGETGQTQKKKRKTDGDGAGSGKKKKKVKA